MAISQTEKFSINEEKKVSIKNVESKVFTLYQCLPQANSPEVHSWLQRAELYIDDLEWLILKLPPYKFWSQMIYDPCCINVVLSFLQNAIPVYLISELEMYESDVKNTYFQIKTLVFTAIRKLTCFEIAESEIMNQGYQGELLYNKMFSLSTIIDICALYAHKYPEHISSMLDTLFQIEPRYSIDLETFVDEVFEDSFDFLEDVFHSKPQLVLSDDEESPKPLSSSSRSSSTVTMSLIADYVIFLLDTAYTLATFVDKHPPAALMFHKNCAEDRIARFYENTVPSMDALVKELISRRQIPVQRESVKNSLKLARYYLLNLYRSCLSSCVSNILSLDIQNNREEISTSVQGFLNTLSDCIEHDIFIADYHTLYPIHNDLDIIQQVAPHIVDSEKIDYLLEIVLMCCNNKVRKSNTPSEASDNIEEESDSIRPVHKKYLSETEVKALISKIKGMLPNLGEGFIQNCLHHYQNNVELTLNNILQDTLPFDLSAIDRQLPYIPPEPVQIIHHRKSTRSNVFDDVIMDIKTVHIGKRGDNEGDMKSLLNDKSHLHEMREFYSKIGVEEYRDASEVVYDDEYDDSYDGPQDLVHVDVLPEDPALKRREMVVPRVLRPPVQRRVEEEESSEEGGDYEDSVRPLDFCQNPEQMRARAEQRRQSRGRGKPVNAPTRDVKGIAKGQGQSKEVLINRNRKNENKAARGNHNRRNAAGRKRAQGMIPS